MNWPKTAISHAMAPLKGVKELNIDTNLTGRLIFLTKPCRRFLAWTLHWSSTTSPFYTKYTKALNFFLFYLLNIVQTKTRLLDWTSVAYELQQEKHNQIFEMWNAESVLMLKNYPLVVWCIILEISLRSWWDQGAWTLLGDAEVARGNKKSSLIFKAKTKALV